MGDVSANLEDAMQHAAMNAPGNGEEPLTPEVHRAFLVGCGLEATPEMVAHLAIMEAALKTYADRSKAYGQAWRHFGAVGQAHDLARKGLRMWKAMLLSRRRDDVINPDDALDCVNYAVFLIRCVAEENVDG